MLATMLGVVPLAAVGQQLANGHIDGPVLIAAEVILAALLAVSIFDLILATARQDRRHAALLAKAASAFMVTTADGTIVYVSPASGQMLGWASEQLVGRSVFDYLPRVNPDDAAGSAQRLIEVFSVPTADATHQLRTTSPHGHEVWLRVSVSNRLADPDIRGVLIRYEDITAQVQAETDLRRRNDLLEAAESLANVGSWESEVGGKAPLWSAQTWRILGLDPSTSGPIDRTTFTRSVHPDDVERVEDAQRRAMETGELIDIDFRIVRPDGEVRDIRSIGRVERDEKDKPTRTIGANLDVTDARRTTGEIRFQADVLSSVREAVVVTDLDGRIRYWGNGAAAFFGYTAEEMLGETMATIFPGQMDSHVADPEGVAGRLGRQDEWEGRRKDGSTVWALMLTTVMRDANGQPSGLIAITSDISEKRSAQAQLARLASAIEQSSESVMIANARAEIEYVNPSFERVSGYRRDEVIGRNARMLKGGVQPASVYQAMWATLSAGRAWIGDFTNRRKDGSLFQEEAVVSPIRDERGAISGYVAVKRDVTEERRLEARAERQARERALTAETIRAITGHETPEETAHEVCRQVIGLAGIVTAGLFVFELDERASAYGFAVAGHQNPALPRLPRGHAAYLREQASRGPWIERWENRAWHPYNELFLDLGVTALAYAPVRDGDEVVGVLGISSASPQADDLLAEVLPALAEFANIASSMVGRKISARAEVAAVRAAIQEVITDGAFSPVFQPIVDMVHGEIVAYEALTRFDDGVAPDARFAQAEAAGMGDVLELATIKAAVEAARSLPAGVWLDVNVSPGVIVGNPDLRDLFASATSPIVVEITEHHAIGDYSAFRAAVQRLGPGVRVAVDDAGAGFASLRHILELHPAFVKLDIGLVAGLDSDKAKRALVAGMRFFADEVGIRLIAEGVETSAELAALRALDVHLAQGYLTGQPEPIDPRAAVPTITEVAPPRWHVTLEQRRVQTVGGHRGRPTNPIGRSSTSAGEEGERHPGRDAGNGRGQERPPRHVDHRDDRRPVAERRVVGEVVRRVGDEAEGGATQRPGQDRSVVDAPLGREEPGSDGVDDVERDGRRPVGDVAHQMADVVAVEVAGHQREPDAVKDGHGGEGGDEGGDAHDRDDTPPGGLRITGRCGRDPRGAAAAAPERGSSRPAAGESR